jgi:HemY protein
MARIEGGQHGDSGRMREWLARAVHAQRDPAWVADGHASSKWAPASPVTGVLDAYRWIDPPESLEPKESDLLLEQLLPMLAPDRTVVAAPKTIAAEPVTIEAAAARPAGPVETPPSPLSSGAPDQHAPARPGVAVHSGANGSAASPPPKQPDGFARPSPSTTGRAASTAPTAKPDAAPTGNGQARPKEHPAGLSRPAPAVEAASPASAISTKPAEQGKGGTIHAQKPASSPQGDAAATTATGVKPARPPAKPASTRPKPEARVFVPPHAPDDPGPEPVEGEESRAPITRFRVPPAKDQA